MSVHHTLRDIEIQSETAIPQQLELMTREVLALRPSLSMEERGYADGLLLKLDGLRSAQQIQPDNAKQPCLSSSVLLPVAVTGHAAEAGNHFAEAVA
jgi:hypothetical protein